MNSNAMLRCLQGSFVQCDFDEGPNSISNAALKHYLRRDASTPSLQRLLFASGPSYLPCTVSSNAVNNNGTLQMRSMLDATAAANTTLFQNRVDEYTLSAQRQCQLQQSSDILSGFEALTRLSSHPSSASLAASVAEAPYPTSSCASQWDSCRGMHNGVVAQEERNLQDAYAALKIAEARHNLMQHQHAASMTVDPGLHHTTSSLQTFPRHPSAPLLYPLAGINQATFLSDPNTMTSMPTEVSDPLSALGAILKKKNDPYIDVAELKIPDYVEPEKQNRRCRGGVTEPFPEKLHRMLLEVEAEGKADVVSFYSHGRAFCVHDMDSFVDEIMPKYFNMSKWNSFARQLNLYGFTRIASGPDAGGYYHELFLQGRPKVCTHMRRVGIPQGHDRRKTRPKNEVVIDPDFYSMKPMVVLAGREAAAA